MTFEEAIEHLDNVKEAEAKDYTDKSGHFDELAFELKNYRLWAKEVHKTIDKLQATYAPKIKMTNIQFGWFEEASEKYKNLEGIYIALYFGDEKSRGISFEMLMQAWLHPELIEVSND